MGFRKALRHIYPTTSEQRCWVHGTAKVLDRMPKCVQSRAKETFHAISMAPAEMWNAVVMAPMRAEGKKALDTFVEMFEAEYSMPTTYLKKDRDVLLMPHDFAAEHRAPIRTTTSIDSVFATVRLRYRKTKGSGSPGHVFKLMESASKRWRALNGSALIADVIASVQFADGVKKAA